MSEMNISTLKPSLAMKAAINQILANIPICFWGGAGIGKSDMVRQIAKAVKLDKVWDIRVAINDPTDLKGVPIPDLENMVVQWLRDNNLPTDPDAKGILFLDEITQGSPMVMGMCYQLVLDRKLGDYVLPKGVRIVMASNRASDRGVVNQMPAPLRNRAWHCEVVPDVTDWATWAVENDVLPEVVAFNRWKGDALHSFSPEMTAFPTPRTMVMLSDTLKQRPDEDIEHALIEGCIGRGHALEFSGFLRTFRSLPDLDGIIRNPDTADVPTEPSVLYALCTGLARKATDANFGDIIKYVRRVGKEFQTLTVMDAIKRDQKLMKNKAYIDLACDLQQLVF